MSGTSATRTSPRPTGRASSTSAARACTSSPTASRCARECRSRRCASGCTRSRTSPTWCPTGPLTTTAPGASACPIASCWSCSRGSTTCVIDSTLEPGHLTYGELRLEGASEEEVLISTYVCHPSLANDNLSGIAVATMLAKQLSQRRLRHSYRFLFAPGTIGPLAWLHQNRDTLHRVKHGLTVSCIGDAGGLTYKRSRRGDSEVDRAVELVLRDSGAAASRRRLGAVGRRRAPVLLSGIRPAGRLPDAHAARRVRRDTTRLPTVSSGSARNRSPRRCAPASMSSRSSRPIARA